MDKVKNLCIYIGVIIVFLFGLGFSIGSEIGEPDYATLYINPESKTYYSPPCLSVVEQNNLIKITSKELSYPEYKPDSKCRDNNGFNADGRSLTGQLLEKFGIIGPLPSRWNPDGSWNW